jgi:uncharacterized OsmC-like protein
MLESFAVDAPGCRPGDRYLSAFASTKRFSRGGLVPMSHDLDKHQHLSLQREEDYRFRVRFDSDGVPDFVTDEAPPMGRGAGPNPCDLLGAAVGSCLASSLLFCYRKSRVDIHDLTVDIVMTLSRNEAGRQRISDIRVEISPEMGSADRDRVDRCTELFESFCTVTESIRQGIHVTIDLKPRVIETSGSTS